MTDTIADLKSFIRAQLGANCDQVPPKTATSQQKHLTVWTTRNKRRPIGLESGHDELVNLWIVSMNAPPTLPDTVKVTKKVWKGSGWQDKDPSPGEKSKGANSNLKPFEVFNTRPITRLGIQSIDDARAILEHLFA